MNHSRNRTGAALLDAVVAAGLVMVTVSVAAPMVVQSARIWKQTRNFQIACDELAGHMDHLISMPSDLRGEALQTLTVDPSLSELLDGVSINGKLSEQDDETRLELSINWKRIGDPPPVILVGWVKPTQTVSLPVDTAETVANESSPDESSSNKTDSTTEAE